MGGITSVFIAILGVVWINFASSMGAPELFTMFGGVFVLVAIGSAIYNFYNALARNRMSEYDVTDRNEEIDPIANRLGYGHIDKEQPIDRTESKRKYEGGFCPFCGAAVNNDFDFCPKCGKDI